VASLKHTTLAHEFLCQTQSPVRAHDAERCDVTVLHAVLRILLHLRKYVAYDLGCIVWCLLGSRDLQGRSAIACLSFHRSGNTYIDSNVAQLWPAKLVVHIVFAEVVLGQIGDVRRLDMRNV